jgi:hypothetical protein
VNEGASIAIRKALYSSNCTKTANFKKANPLNVMDFYMNIEYWLAESRVPSYYLEDKACTAIILDSVRGAGTPVSVVFVDKDGNVTAVFKRY